MTSMRTSKMCIAMHVVVVTDIWVVYTGGIATAVTQK